MLSRVGELPVTMAAFPFGFEIPLHDPRPDADIGLSLVGGSRTAEAFKEAQRSGSAHPIMTGIAGILEETDREESALCRIVGRKMLLEYDVHSASTGALPDPGIFLYPDQQALAGGDADGKSEDIGVMLDALDSAVNRDPDPGERRQVEQVYRALGTDTHIGAAGTFPSRTRMVRLALMGFRKKNNVKKFLERVNWCGQQSAVEATLSPFEDRDAFERLGVHLDVHATGVGPTLGLSLYAREGQWLKGGESWTAIIEGIRETGIAIPEKLSELQNWASRSEPFTGKSGPFVVVRGIHHFKITLSGDRVDSVKGYIFLLLFSWPLDLSSSD